MPMTVAYECETKTEVDSQLCCTEMKNEER